MLILKRRGGEAYWDSIVYCYFWTFCCSLLSLPTISPLSEVPCKISYPMVAREQRRGSGSFKSFRTLTWAPNWSPLVKCGVMNNGRTHPGEGKIFLSTLARGEWYDVIPTYALHVSWRTFRESAMCQSSRRLWWSTILPIAILVPGVFIG